MSGLPFTPFLFSNNQTVIMVSHPPSIHHPSITPHSFRTARGTVLGAGAKQEITQKASPWRIKGHRQLPLSKRAVGARGSRSVGAQRVRWVLPQSWPRTFKWGSGTDRKLTPLVLSCGAWEHLLWPCVYRAQPRFSRQRGPRVMTPPGPPLPAPDDPPLCD